MDRNETPTVISLWNQGKKRGYARHSLVEMLKQNQYVPLRASVQVLQVFAGTQSMPGTSRSWVRDLPKGDIVRYCAELSTFVEEQHAELLDRIDEGGKLKGELRDDVEACLKAFSEIFVPTSAS